ncbi:MAG: hypothetical protein SFW07_06255 [Gammaproteobacteria bacterium]|nr:hypothetical protein [Gammaproteobacteria bacterium]
MKDALIISPIEIVGLKQKPVLYFDPENIENFNLIPDIEKKSFLKLAQTPQFCGKHGETGIKQITHNPPTCQITFQDKQLTASYAIKYEMKIVGASKEGRIGLCEIETSDKNNPTALVAVTYLPKGFHTAKSTNKKYSISMEKTGFFAVKKDSHSEKLSSAKPLSKNTANKHR